MSSVQHNCKNEEGLHRCWFVVAFVVAERGSLLRLVYRISSLKSILVDPDSAIMARLIPLSKMSLYTLSQWRNYSLLQVQLSPQYNSLLNFSPFSSRIEHQGSLGLARAMQQL